jgi:alpha-acetolactate decarboxylase
MNKSIYTIVFVLLTILITSCESKVTDNKRIAVKYSGALGTIMSGDIKSTISLDSLSNKANIYALGATENLKGEIQIFNGKPSNSFVIDSSLRINDSYNLKASLLVYAEIEEWNEFNLDNIATKDDLERAIFETANANGINTEVPFPFLFKGTVESLDWHVINWTDGDKVHTHKKHKESGLNGRLKNRTVKVLGFYSTKHKAIFTHHTTNMHMHFKTVDNSVAGHIDDIRLNAIILSLPKSKK